MMEITIHGRGGQGGVTLAKLLASAYFNRGQFAQAFGVYAAERSGAPVQAFVRISPDEIFNYNQIREPDHIIVIDRTLIQPVIAAGQKADGWIILNTSAACETFFDMFPGRQVATFDATGIALAHKLGTRSVPIVNTTMLGAVLRILQQPWEAVENALRELRFGDVNLTVARLAFDSVRGLRMPGDVVQITSPHTRSAPTDVLDPHVGELPAIRTGSWATRRPQRQRLLSPCSGACPAGNDIQAFVESCARNDYDAALETLLKTSPFPGVCGRVCPAPCMDSCNRHLIDEPVQIRELERMVAERGHLQSPGEPWRDERVAVIGSGPAGLSAAYHLARLGYRVAVFDGGSELGGLLRTGIPEYRLPQEVLNREIAYIMSHGIEAHTQHFVDRARLLELSVEFDALFVATGLQQTMALDLGVADREVVREGIEFLDSVRHGGQSMNGLRVVVIGGGNTAVDAARSALRLGAQSVRILYRRTRHEMPAIKEEVEEAIDEGVRLDELMAPLHLRRVGGHWVLACGRMTLGEPDESGRRVAVPIETEDSMFDVPCDKVILALGQSSDLSILPEGAEIRDREKLLGLAGSVIFVGGDFASNDGSVAAAIGSGRKAAWHIHKTLSGEDLFPAVAPSIAGPELMHMHVFSPKRAEHAMRLPPVLRRRTFNEVRMGLCDQPAVNEVRREAQRCMSCGVCDSCDRCVEYCPEGVLRHDADGYHFDYGYCKGCGICATQCPRGVTYMAEI